MGHPEKLCSGPSLCAKTNVLKIFPSLTNFFVADSIFFLLSRQTRRMMFANTSVLSFLCLLIDDFLLGVLHLKSYLR